MDKAIKEIEGTRFKIDDFINFLQEAKKEGATEVDISAYVPEGEYCGQDITDIYIECVRVVNLNLKETF
jgi:hypothetical protein